MDNKTKKHLVDLTPYRVVLWEEHGGSGIGGSPD